MAGYSPSLPLVVDNQDGFCKLTKDLNQVARQNIKMLVLTSPGERMMDPEFGVGLYNYIFEQDSGVLRGQITSKINQQVQKYLPYIDIINIEYQSSLTDSFGVNDNYLGVRIQYKIIPLNIISNININLD